MSVQPELLDVPQAPRRRSMSAILPALMALASGGPTAASAAAELQPLPRPERLDGKRNAAFRERRLAAARAKRAARRGRRQ